MEGLEPQKPKKDADRFVPLDEIARKGHLKEGDLPGVDSYDDGMDEKGELKPGSTLGGSVGTYMEDTGPQDLKHARVGAPEAAALEAGLNVVEGEALHDDPNLDPDDPATKWLMENDPEFKKKRGGKRELQ